MLSFYIATPVSVWSGARILRFLREVVSWKMTLKGYSNSCFIWQVCDYLFFNLCMKNYIQLIPTNKNIVHGWRLEIKVEKDNFNLNKRKLVSNVSNVWKWGHNTSEWLYQSSGGNPELRSPQTQYFLFLLHSARLRPLNIATVPLKDGAQPLQQNHASGASHGATSSSSRKPDFKTPWLHLIPQAWPLPHKERGPSGSLISHIPNVPLKSQQQSSAKTAESCPLEGWASTDKLLIQRWASTLWLFFPTSLRWRMLRHSSLPPSLYPLPLLSICSITLSFLSLSLLSWIAPSFSFFPSLTLQLSHFSEWACFVNSRSRQANQLSLSLSLQSFCWFHLYNIKRNNLTCLDLLWLHQCC